MAPLTATQFTVKPVELTEERVGVAGTDGAETVVAWIPFDEEALVPPELTARTRA